MTNTYEIVQARMAKSAGAALVEAPISRRLVLDNDVKIRINYCGVCHTDLHLVNDDWGISNYPLVPGHEIVGEVIETGAKIQNFQPGDIVGVGPFVNSCNACGNCEAQKEQYCSAGVTDTYNAIDPIDGTITYGGFSEVIVINHRFVVHRAMPKSW